MKKAFSIFMIASLAFMVISCSTKTTEEPTVVVSTETVSKKNVNTHAVDWNNPPYALKNAIPVKKDDFEKMVQYIEKHGTTKNSEGIPCIKEFTFTDTNGTTHVMSTTKQDNSGNLSSKGSIDDIWIDAFIDGNINLDNYFGYYITEEYCTTTIFFKEHFDSYISNVRVGYNEFLVLVNK